MERSDSAHLLSLEIWDTEQHLHHRIEVATVAQVADTSVSRPIEGLELHTGLLDELPLPNALVHVYFQFCHGLVCLWKERTGQTLKEDSREHQKCENGNAVEKHKGQNPFCFTKREEKEIPEL